MIAVIVSLGIGGISSTVAVTAANSNYQRLFRNSESNWIITKEDIKETLNNNQTNEKVTVQLLYYVEESFK